MSRPSRKRVYLLNCAACSGSGRIRRYLKLRSGGVLVATRECECWRIQPAQRIARKEASR